MKRLIVLLLALALTVGQQYAPGVQAARQATPAAEAGDSDLAQILGYLPNVPLDQSGGLVTYADPARQAAASGLTPPTDDGANEAWLDAARTLNLPQSTGQFWALPEWRAAYGFGLEQVDRVVEFSAPPLAITVIQGRFDEEELRTAWAQAGYQPVDLGSGEAFAIREDFALDLADPDARMAMAYLNVVALSDDGTLILSSAREGVRRALEAASGEASSLAERPDIAPLVQAAPEDLVSAVIINGSSLQAMPDPAEIIVGQESPEAFATRAAEELQEAQNLPPVGAALLGQTAGQSAATEGSPVPATPATMESASLVAILTMGGEDAAQQAAQVIDERLENGESPALLGERLGGKPWRELFPRREVRAASGSPAVVMALVPAPDVPLNLLQAMVFQRSPGFLGW